MPLESGFMVIVTRRTLSERMGGLAVLKGPVPVVVPPVDVSMIAASNAGSVVLFVTFAIVTGDAFLSVEVVAPDCAPNTIDVPAGVSACQSNSRHLMLCPLGHVPLKSCVNVADWNGGGPGGGPLSGATHDVRSKNMNSSACSCAIIGWLAHA